MNNDIIKQTMIESFEAIKDSWKTKKDSIIRCIVETDTCDGDLAMDMWQYVIINNSDILNSKEGNIQFIDDVILRFNKKYEHYDIPWVLCKTILNHIAPYLANKKELLNIIFGKLIDAGYSGAKYYYDLTEPLPACLACLLLQDDSMATSTIIKALANNKKLYDIQIGKLLIKTNFYFDEMYKNRYEYTCDIAISDSVKESLLSCLDMINDKDDKAEIALSLMAR